MTKTGTVEYRPDETKKLQEDGFYKLENTAVDQKKQEEDLPRLDKLIKHKVCDFLLKNDRERRKRIMI